MRVNPRRPHRPKCFDIASAALTGIPLRPQTARALAAAIDSRNGSTDSSQLLAPEKRSIVELDPGCVLAETRASEEFPSRRHYWPKRPGGRGSRKRHRSAIARAGSGDIRSP